MSEKPTIDRFTFGLPDDIPAVINKNTAINQNKLFHAYSDLLKAF